MWGDSRGTASLPDAGSHTVFTLGPGGTDAHAEAVRLFSKVELCSSFPEAMATAFECDQYAMVTAGYVELSGGSTTDSWVSLHFKYHSKMDLIETWHAPTKPMCVAIHIGFDRPSSVALHPATAAFADVFGLPAERTFVRAKPAAAQLAAEGAVTACIASVDVVAQHPQLRPMQIFQPKMVWCLYRRFVNSADA